MSLQVWLPLIDDVHNQGASGTTVINNGATVNTSGKIGSCYAFNGSTGYIALSGSDLFKIFTGGTQQFSITMWVFHADATRAILFGDYATSGGIGFNIELSTAHGVRFYWNGAPDTYPANATVAASDWTHVALTYDGTKLQSYINGVEKGSWSGTLAEKNKTSGEFRLGRDNRSDSTAFNGRMNDFRIYDHALSAAEVKEISQGLVLHYKLNDINLSPPNLLVNSLPHTGTLTSWSSAGANWTNSIVIDNGISAVRSTYTGTTQTSGGIHHPATSKDVYEDGATYTFSGWVRASKACRASFHNELMTNTGAQINVTTDWQFFSKTSTIDKSKTYSSNVFYVVAADVTQNMWIEAREWKVEKSSAPTGWIPHTSDSIYNGFMSKLTNIEDSSGYNHNATSNGSAAVTLDSSTTAKYSCSAKFISGARIAMPVASSTCLPTDAITVSIWYKSSDGTARFLSCTEGGGWNFEVNSSKASFPFYIKGKGYGRVLATQNFYSDNAWHMITASYDGVSTAKIYLDGQLNNTATITSGWENIPLAYNASTPLTLGAEAQTIASPIAGTYVGNLSDLRIYCTALSNDAVLELYHTGAKVDNKQNLHTFELVEGSSAIKINKRGQTLCNELEENTATKFFKTNQIVETNEIIEL